jgi:MarR family transcriptional regulator for hemolysin
MPANNKAEGQAGELHLGALLADALRLLRRDFYQHAKGLNLTPALARLLFYVARSPGLSQVDLAAKLEVTPVTLSRMIDRLVKARYVRREADPADRRVYRVVLERAALSTVSRMRRLSYQTTTRALRGFSKREQATLATQLATLCSNLLKVGA